MNYLRKELGTCPYPYDKERASRVRAELGRRCMSASALARAIDEPQSCVSDVINGRRFTRSIERKIAVYLGLPLDYLFPQRSMSELIDMRKTEQAGSRSAV